MTSSSNLNVVITGGAGFIGSNLADRCIELGHSVAIIDNMVTGQRQNLPRAARFYEMDICNKSVQDVFEKEKPDIVFHLAAQMDVRKSVEDPIYDANVNVVGGLNLLEAAVKTGVKKFIFASTGGAIYGEQDYFPADEQHPVKPLSPYGITKLTTEKYLYFYNQTHGINYTCLRFANVYGPRQNPHGEAGVVAIFSKRMLQGEQPVINGAGTQTRDYVYVADVVRACEMAIHGGDNRIYNIGTGIETDVNTLFTTIASFMEHEVEQKHGPGAAGEQQRSVLSTALIEEEMGWKPQTTLEEGLKRTVAFFREQQSS